MLTVSETDIFKGQNLLGFSDRFKSDEDCMEYLSCEMGGKGDGKPGPSYDSRKKKVVGAVQLSERGKVKHFYTVGIDDFSSGSLEVIFDRHVDLSAKVTTDEWWGRLIAKVFR